MCVTQSVQFHRNQMKRFQCLSSQASDQSTVCLYGLQRHALLLSDWTVSASFAADDGDGDDDGDEQQDEEDGSSNDAHRVNCKQQ